MNTLDFIKLSLATRGGLAIELMTFTEVKQKKILENYKFFTPQQAVGNSLVQNTDFHSRKKIRLQNKGSKAELRRGPDLNRDTLTGQA